MNFGQLAQQLEGEVLDVLPSVAYGAFWEDFYVRSPQIITFSSYEFGVGIEVAGEFGEFVELIFSVGRNSVVFLIDYTQGLRLEALLCLDYQL
jgi:hypothetical protein